MKIYHVAKEPFYDVESYIEGRNPISDFGQKLYASLTEYDSIKYAEAIERNWILEYEIPGNNVYDFINICSNRGFSTVSFGSVDNFSTETDEGILWGQLIFASRSNDYQFFSPYSNTDVLFGPRADIQANRVVNKYINLYYDNKWDYQNRNDIAEFVVEIDPWHYADQLALSKSAAGFYLNDIYEENWHYFQG